MKNKFSDMMLCVVLAVIVTVNATGCASSMATQEEIAQLEAINMEIQSLENHKANLQHEYEVITVSISGKESELDIINRRKKEISQSN